MDDASQKTPMPARQITNAASPEMTRLQPFSSSDKKEPGFLPMVHGKATDSVARMIGKKTEKNLITNICKVESGGVTLSFSDLGKRSTVKLGVSTHKLLSAFIARFTAINHTGNTRELKTLSVSISLKEYATLLGYDVTVHDTETPEEQEKEALRAKIQLDNARKKIKGDLDILYAASLDWQEKVRGKQADFAQVRLIQKAGIRNGYINVTFSNDLGDYLIQLPMTQYPVALLGMDERNPNAYNMGLQMAEHYSMDRNLINGTSQLLKVKTLLEYTNLPSVETIKHQKMGWEGRIKEPFENSLDALTKCGFLADWEYCHSKGIPMTDEEVVFLTFEDWTDTLIKFTIVDAPDHSARLEARAEEKKAQRKRRKTTKKSK